MLDITGCQNRIVALLIVVSAYSVESARKVSVCYAIFLPPRLWAASRWLFFVCDRQKSIGAALGHGLL